MTDDSEQTLKYIKTFGNKYMNSIFDVEKDKEPVYGKKHIPIGRKKSGGIYYLDLEHACRILILGMTRSGKTFLLREMADRFNKAGYAVIFLPDVKDEFKSSRKPVQPQFYNLLLQGEVPRPMNVVTFRPTFFKAMDERLAKGNIWYSPHFANVTRADFMTLFNAESLTVNQQVMLEMLYESIRKNMNESKEFNLDDIDSIIDNIADLTPASKTQMKFKFRPFKTSRFYEKQHMKSVVTAIQSGIVPAINMEGFDNFGRGNFSYPEVVFSIVLRAVINARRHKKIPPVWVIVDEASRFIPKDQNPSCKRVVMECLHPETKIITKDGHIAIKDMNEGQEVLSFNFKTQRKVWNKCHIHQKKKKKLYKITLNDGRVVIASAEHRFFVKNSSDFVSEKMLKDIVEGESIVTISGNFRYKNCGELNAMSGKENKHKEQTKIRIKNAVKNYYNSDSGQHAKKVISESSKRAYDVRLGVEKSNEIKKRRKMQMTDKRNHDKRFDANVVKANFGKTLSKEWRSNIGKSCLNYYSSLSDIEKAKFMKKTLWKNRGNKKTNLEVEAEKQFLKNNIELEYIGNRPSKGIAGLVPDFINRKNKIIVEVFADYWKIVSYGSVEEYKTSRKKIFEDLGYKILFFNDRDVYSGVMLHEVQLAFSANTEN